MAKPNMRRTKIVVRIPMDIKNKFKKISTKEEKTMSQKLRKFIIEEIGRAEK